MTGDLPDGIITFDGELTPGQVARLRALWNAVSGDAGVAYDAGRAAERERIFRTPATQRFIIEDGLWCCAGCGECVTENRIEHQAGCSEMRLADLLDGAS